jgi:uridine kinase
MIIKQLDVPWVVLLCMDSFYKVLSPEESAKAYNNDYNFDHPSAFDYDLLFETLKDLKAGKSVNVPNYDFKTHSRTKNSRHVYGATVVIFEGILSLYDQRINELMDLKIFVDTDDDIRLSRRLKRDITERGRDLQGVLKQYQRFVKPAFDSYIRPTMKYADVIIPRGADNVVAVNLCTDFISLKLDERGYSMRSKLAQIAKSIDLQNHVMPSHVTVLPATPQLKYIQTMIRDQDTCRDDFVFFAERLSRLVVEAALSLLPFQTNEVTTPTGSKYEGKARKENLCGVSIIRSGLAMEKPLRKVCPNVSMGKLLIQYSPGTREPHLHYCILPQDVKDMFVLLCDAVIGTGAAMLMAIKVLLEHGVAEERVIVLSLIGTPLGLDIICGCFPKVKIVVSEVDWPGIDLTTYRMVPGLGNFGDRYFGTDLKE